MDGTDVKTAGKNGSSVRNRPAHARRNNYEIILKRPNEGL